VVPVPLLGGAALRPGELAPPEFLQTDVQQEARLSALLAVPEPHQALVLRVVEPHRRVAADRLRQRRQVVVGVFLEDELRYGIVTQGSKLGAPAVTANYPPNGATGVNPDTHLVITCPSPPTLGTTGTIRIYDAADGALVDTLDLSIPPGPTAGPGALAGRVPYTPVPYAYTPGRRPTNADTTPGTPSGAAEPTPRTSQLTIIGGFTDAFHFYPVIVRGNTATIYPHNDLLKYGRSYRVQIDPGVLTCGSGFNGVAARGWKFSTKRRPPAAGTTRVVVAADGRGDFNTIQGALDFVPDRSETRVTIFVRNGGTLSQKRRPFGLSRGLVVVLVLPSQPSVSRRSVVMPAKKNPLPNRAFPLNSTPL